jgi:hypothetical protein
VIVSNTSIYRVLDRLSGIIARVRGDRNDRFERFETCAARIGYRYRVVPFGFQRKKTDPRTMYCDIHYTVIVTVAIDLGCIAYRRANTEVEVRQIDFSKIKTERVTNFPNPYE